MRTYFGAYRRLDGLMAPAAGTSSIQELVTGLSFVSDRSATGNKVISVHVGSDGTYAVLAALDAASQDCWGVLYITARQPRPILGESAPAIYFFVRKHVTNGGCNAATVSPSLVSSSNWPDQ